MKEFLLNLQQCCGAGSEARKNIGRSLSRNCIDLTAVALTLTMFNTLKFFFNIKKTAATIKNQIYCNFLMS
jgi:hypothetical protein